MAKKNNLWLWLAGGVAAYLIIKGQNPAPAAPANSAVTPGTAATASPVTNAVQTLAANVTAAVNALATPLKQMIGPVTAPNATQYPQPPVPAIKTISVPVNQAPLQSVPKIPQMQAPLIEQTSPIVVMPAVNDANYYEFVNGDYPGAKNQKAAISGCREMGGC